MNLGFWIVGGIWRNHLSSKNFFFHISEVLHFFHSTEWFNLHTFKIAVVQWICFWQNRNYFTFKITFLCSSIFGVFFDRYFNTCHTYISHFYLPLTHPNTKTYQCSSDFEQNELFQTTEAPKVLQQSSHAAFVFAFSKSWPTAAPVDVKKINY